MTTTDNVTLISYMAQAIGQSSFNHHKYNTLNSFMLYPSKLSSVQMTLALILPGLKAITLPMLRLLSPKAQERKDF